MTNQMIMYANNDVEKTILSCIMRDYKELDLSGISEKDFCSEQNKEIFKTIKEMSVNDLAIDFITILDRIKKENALDYIGGYEYLTEINDFAPTTSNYEHYKRLLKEYSVKRQILKATEKIKEILAKDTDGDVLTLAQEQLDNINKYEEKRLLSTKELFMLSVENLMERKNNKELKGVKTGLKAIDKYIVNIQPTDFTVIGARSGMGKSVFMLTLANNNALQFNKRSLLFSLEMAQDQCMDRLIISQSSVNGVLYRSGKVRDYEFDSIKKNSTKFDHDLILIDDTPNITIGEIEATAKKVMKEKGLDLIIIDYLQLITPEKKYESKHQEVADTARRLKILAKKLQVPIVCLSQVSRSCEARGDKRPMLSDLKESGGIEENADLVMFLYRDEYYNPNTIEKNIIEVIVAKNRYGYTGTIKCAWQGEYQRILDIAQNV